MIRIEVDLATGAKQEIELTPSEVADAEARTAEEKARQVAALGESNARQALESRRAKAKEDLGRAIESLSEEQQAPFRLMLQLLED